MVIDHGSIPTAHLVSQSLSEGDSIMNKEDGLCVTFAGPILKADDVIARDTQWLLNRENVTQVIVITNDRELSYRCRHYANPAAGTSKEKRKLKKKTRKGRKMDVKRFNEQQQQLLVASGEDGNITDATPEATNNSTMRVNVISSKLFLEDMEYAMQQFLNEAGVDARIQNPSPESSTAANDAAPSNDIPSNSQWHKLYELRSKILHLESCLRKKCTVRKRQQLTQEMRRCKEQWETELLSIGDKDSNESNDDETLGELMKMSLSNSLSLDMSSQSNPLDKVDTEDQKQMLLRWGYRRGSPKREATEDRVILAEMVRSQLEVALDNDSDDGTISGDKSLVQLYASYINSMI